MTLVLGSQSPRRREILNFFNLAFIQANPSFDELSVAFEKSPEQYAIDIARGKAISLLPVYPQHIILTADTVVYCEGKVYGKPNDYADALRMLRELAGRWHSVFTALTLKTTNEEHTICEESRVQFQAATDHQLERYCQAIHCLDKAGGYAIQTAGGVIVRRVEGCYYNVMGLPIAGLCTILSKVGIDLWDYLK